MTPLSRRQLAAVAAAVAAIALLPITAAAGTVSTPAGKAAGVATKTAPPVPMPAHPHGLKPPQPMGDEVDGTPGYQPQQACLAKAMPGTVKLVALALSTYGRGGTSPATPRACTIGEASEHKDGRAWDWMLSAGNKADRKVAADFLSWLTGPGPSGEQGEMASRLGVMYVIFNRKIWASYAPGWRDYTGYDPHTTHIHISLSWNGARAHTSFWTGRVWPTDYGVCQVFQDQPAVVPHRSPRTDECPSPVPAPRGSTQSLAWLGSSGTPVTQAQQLLGTTANGSFGAATRNAVLGYQKSHDLPRTGALDAPTWASLQPSSQQYHVPHWTAAKAAAWARNAGSPPLHFGAAGKTVYALQVALRMDDAWRNGYYGASTRALVIELKTDLGLPATARVTPEVWAALPVH